jgi:hypothetical protein
MRRKCNINIENKQ